MIKAAKSAPLSANVLLETVQATTILPDALFYFGSKPGFGFQSLLIVEALGDEKELYTQKMLDGRMDALRHRSAAKG